MRRVSQRDKMRGAWVVLDVEEHVDELMEVVEALLFVEKRVTNCVAISKHLTTRKRKKSVKKFILGSLENVEKIE